jgi:hypothetical protein
MKCTLPAGRGALFLYRTAMMEALTFVKATTARLGVRYIF